jgi:GAF domain-containing protein
MTSWFAAVRDIQAAILSGAGLHGALGLICSQAAALMAGHSTCIAMPDGEGRLVVEAADGSDAAALRGERAPSTESVMGEVVAMGAAAVLDDLSSQGSFAEPFTALDLGPALFVPLNADAGGYGVLCVARRRGSPLFDEDEVAVAEAFAAQASLAVSVEARQHQLSELAAAAARLVALPLSGGPADEGARMVEEAVDEVNRVMVDIEDMGGPGYDEPPLGTLRGA